MATSKQIEQEAYVWKKLGQAGFGMDSNRPEAPLGPEAPEDSRGSESVETASDEAEAADAEPLTEGAMTSVRADRYERSRAARQACIKAHSATCAICGFDFAKAYGPQFAGIIQVHHVVPLHQTAAKHVVDPVRDLIPVCPNCHVALHAKPGGGTYTPDELRLLMGLVKGSR